MTGSRFNRGGLYSPLSVLGGPNGIAGVEIIGNTSYISGKTFTIIWDKNNRNLMIQDRESADVYNVSITKR